MRQYYRVMAPGDSERPDRPEYNVYRAGGRGRGRRAEPQADEQTGKPERSGDEARSRPPSEGPGYSVYRARRGFKRTGSAGPSLRDRLSGKGGGGSKPLASGEQPRWRRILKWVAIAAGAWLLISFAAFAISAQIQKGKLNSAAADELGGFPFLLAQGQNILVIGTDARPEGSDEAGAETKPKCLDAAAHGDPPPSTCLPSRADTLMVVHAGGGSFSKISIPRDTLASIPGEGDQRINAAYAFGGAALQIKTVEAFLGIDINHVVILDFAGFADFIDAIGGVTVNLPDKVHSTISGGGANGGVTLHLDRGSNHLDGQQALALARTRENKADPSEDDTDRARRQQLILQGIKGQLTSPWRAPINFIKGPWIAWNAPKAMVSDMGGFVLPQVALSAAIGGDSGTKVLIPSGTTSDGALLIPKKQCRAAVKRLVGGAGPHPPKCSPGADPAATETLTP
jgi:LCP family protein required for cell wall assembly